MLTVHMANEMHPVDAYEFLHRHSQREVARAATAANKMVGSDLFAQFCGNWVNASIAAEDWRRTFMPFWPEISLQMMKVSTDQAVQWTAMNWGMYLDAVRGDDRKDVQERTKVWRRVLNTHYPIAVTPKELVHEEGVVKLYRYSRPAHAGEKKRVPLLLVFAIMNTPWILDLYKGNSFTEHMVARGYDVYLVDWGTPGQSEKHWTFETYSLVHLPKLIAKVKQLSGSNEFSMLGWCLGALITALYASLRPDDGLKNLMLLTAPLDFSDDEHIIFRKWLQHLDIERLLNHHGGMMPAERIEAGAQMLKPIDNGIRNYLSLWNRLGDEKFVNGWHAMHTWLSMNVPIAGGAYRQLVNDLYLGNNLCNGAGGLRLKNETANLGNIRADVLALIAESDHITPPSQMDRAFPSIGSHDKTLIRMPGGHIGVMAGGAAQTKAWPALDSWLAPRSR